MLYVWYIILNYLPFQSCQPTHYSSKNWLIRLILGFEKLTKISKFPDTLVNIGLDWFDTSTQRYTKFPLDFKNSMLLVHSDSTPPTLSSTSRLASFSQSLFFFFLNVCPGFIELHFHSINRAITNLQLPVACIFYVILLPNS